MIECRVAVSQYISECDDEIAVWNPCKERCIQLAQPAKSVPGNLELPLDGGLALVIRKVCGKRPAAEELAGLARSVPSVRAEKRLGV